MKSSSILLQEPSKQSSNTDSCGNLADSYWLCIYLWQFQRHVNLYQHNMNLYLWRFQRYLYLFVTIFLLKVFRTVSCDYSSQYIYYPLFIVIIKFHIFSWELIPSVIFSTSICVVRWWNEWILESSTIRLCREQELAFKKFTALQHWDNFEICSFKYPQLAPCIPF